MSELSQLFHVQSTYIWKKILRNLTYNQERSMTVNTKIYLYKHLYHKMQPQSYQSVCTALTSEYTCIIGEMNTYKAVPDTTTIVHHTLRGGLFNALLFLLH